MARGLARGPEKSTLSTPTLREVPVLVSCQLPEHALLYNSLRSTGEMSSNNSIGDPDDLRFNSEDPLATHPIPIKTTTGTAIRSGTKIHPSNNLSKKSNISDSSSSILFGPGAPGSAKSGSSAALTNPTIRTGGRKLATNRNRGGASLVPIVIFLIGAAACLGIWSSVRYVNHVAVPQTSNTVKSKLLEQYTKGGRVTATAAETGADPGAHHPQLHCQAYGGPAEEAAQEMVYWQGWTLSVK